MPLPLSVKKYLWEYQRLFHSSNKNNVIRVQPKQVFNTVRSPVTVHAKA